MTQFDPVEIDLAGVHSIDASAGTGKTYTIATLYLRYIVEKQVPIEQILVTTFTEAATAELRDRLRQRLHAALVLCKTSRIKAEALSKEKNGGDVGEDFRILDKARAWDAAGLPDLKVGYRLELALTMFDQSSIFTIHGFCNQLLTQLVFETHSRFDADMVDSLRPQIERAVDDYLASNWCQKSSALNTWLPLKADIREDLMKAAEAAVGEPECVLEPSAGELAELLSDGEMQKFNDAAKELAELWPQSRDKIVADIESAMSDRVLRRNIFTDSGFEKAIRMADIFAVSPHPDRFEAKLDKEKLKFESKLDLLSQSKMNASTSNANKGKTPTHEVFKIFDRLVVSAELIYLQTKQIRARVLTHGVQAVQAKVESAKQAEGILSFADMLDLVDRAIASDPEGDLVTQLRAKFPVVLVDEFQDTDPVQYRIFSKAFQKAAANDTQSRRAFVMIGDPKQSIYRFRGADLNCYFAATRADTVQRHTMGKNWRSDRSLVAGVLALLGPSPFGNAPMDLPPVDAHHDDRYDTGDDGSAIEIRLVPGHPSGSLNKKLAFRQVLRHLVHDIVKELNNDTSLLKDDQSLRRVLPKDIAVLCRAGWQLREIQRELSVARVPTVLCTDQSVFDTAEAEDLHRVLLAIIAPNDRRAVTTALATPIFGLSAEELVDLAGEDGNALADRLRQFYEWQQLWNDRGFMVFLKSLLKELGTMPRLASEINGERTLTNLRHLGELLHGKASADHLGPSQLVDWMGRALEDEDHREHASDEMQIRLESDADAVQLSTIHKSKGLEYPVVYCPTLWDTRERLKQNDPPYVVVRANDNGEPREKPLIDTGTDNLSDRLDHDFEEQRDEERRLLYVALTRPRHACRIYWACTGSAHQSALGDIAKVPGFNPRGNQVPFAERDKQIFDRLKVWIQEISQEGETKNAVTLRDYRNVIIDQSAIQFKGSGNDENELSLRDVQRKYLPALVTTSFSSLASVASRQSTDLEADPLLAIDRDNLSELVRTTESDAEQKAVKLAEMPGGRRVGDLVHDVLEKALLDKDLNGSREDELAKGIKKMLAPKMARVNTKDEDWLDRLGDSLAYCLTARLDDVDGCSLIGVKPEDLAPEVGFMLGAGRESSPFKPLDLAAALRNSGNETVRRYASTIQAIDQKQMNGFLGGFIDLVFRWDGKWYLLDYKTNKLGRKLGDYGTEGIAHAMIHHHYVLQYHLYAVALHQLLTKRIGRDEYNYEKHFGGCLYLFLRGMDKDGGSKYGVYFDQPSESVIESLSDVLAGEVVAK